MGRVRMDARKRGGEGIGLNTGDARTSRTGCHPASASAFFAIRFTTRSKSESCWSSNSRHFASCSERFGCDAAGDFLGDLAAVIPRPGWAGRSGCRFRSWRDPPSTWTRLAGVDGRITARATIRSGIRVSSGDVRPPGGGHRLSVVASCFYHQTRGRKAGESGNGCQEDACSLIPRDDRRAGDGARDD